MATSIIAQIRNDDPSFDPLATALASAKVSREKFDAAFDRVVVDGNFGPISPADWREQDGREPTTVSEALAILGRVSDEIDDYRSEFTAYCPLGGFDTCTEDPENCGGHTDYEIVATAEDIRRAVFGKVVNIYGNLPF